MTRTTLNRRHLPKNKRSSRAETSLKLERLEDRCLLSGGIQVNLSSAFNRTGIVADGTKFSGGGLDGGGYALSSSQVGTTLTAGGATFDLGPVGANDVVSTAGQTIALPAGRDVSLDLLATGVNGNQTNQTFTVKYSDGTTATFTQSLSDWFSPQNYSGESKAVTMAYRDLSNGTKDNQTFFVYGYTFALNSAKTVSSLTLPNDANVEVLAATTTASSSTATASFIKQDTSTQGKWIGTYGTQGYDVIGDATSLPSYATITPAGQSSYTWEASTTDPRALQNAGGSGNIAACWYSGSSFTVNVNLTDGQTHDLELYFVDWDTTTRAEQVQISNASTGAVLSTENLTSFHSGDYLNWAVSGNLLITITNQSGSLNAVLSGLFLDPPQTTTPPTVTAETPTSGATGVAVSSTATATFSEAVQASTINFTLTPKGGSPVAASVAYNSSSYTATLTPSSALAYSTTYTATVSGVLNNSGVAMTSPFSWSFTTAAASAPIVTSETPLSGATNVAVSSTATATFNQPVQSGTISFTLTPKGGSPVAASMTYNSSNDTATLTPSAALAYSTAYTATVSGAQNSSGVAMTSPFTWSFTTMADPPSTPYVSSETPMPATLNLALSTVPTVTFNQPVQSSTIVFTLKNEFGTAVAGSVSYNSSTNTATFAPSAALPASTTYTATVSGAKNSAGVAMSSPVSWEFITDAGSPTVTTESPTSGGTSVGLSTPVTATFSEPVQAGTIIFTLTPSGGSPVAATVTYSPATFKATLTPSSPLSASTTYKASVSGADVEGDSMVASSWSFTTGSASSLQNGLVAEWQFNEGKGTTTADDTGNGHNGTLSGTVSWVQGLTGPYALNFRSSSLGHVSVPDSPSLDFSATQSYSLSAWVYVPSLPGAWTGVVAKSTDKGNYYGIWINASNQWDGSAGSSAVQLVGPTAAIGWSQVTLVQNGSSGTLALYVDGVQVATGKAQNSSGTGVLCIGGDNGVDAYFNGAIDDVRVYNSALSGSEVQGLVATAPMMVMNETPSPATTSTSNLPTLTASFSQVVQASTIKFTLTSSSGTSVPGTITYDGSTNTAAFTPNAILPYSTTYTATVTGSASNSGKSATASWSFTTPAAPRFAPGASIGEYIDTDLNTIPNYGYNPTVVSVANGSWSSGSTWSTGQVPGAGAVVSIASGTTVTYDADSTTVLSAITIQPGGTLQFSTSVNTEVIAANYLVLPGGTLDVGTQSNPIPAGVNALIETANQTINTTFDPSQYGDSLIGLGNVSIYGAAKTPFVQLAVGPQAGATTLYLGQPVTGWQVGDELYLPDTRELDSTDDPQSGNYVAESETATIASISPNGLVVTLTSPLQYSHLGAADSSGNLAFLPQVVDETRNVVIRSQNGGGTRGVVMFLQNANVNINYADFLSLGRTTNATISDTTYNSAGQVTAIGTNQQDRSPIDFLDLWGPTTPQADGFQYSFVGNVVNCPMNPQTHIWGIEVNNSDYGLIEGNFVINWYGAGISFVSGAEYDNMIEGNFVTEISGTGLRDTTGLDGTGYWVPAPQNSFIDNVATDINPSGTYSYGFDIDAQYVGPNGNGLVNVPLYQGADPTQPGQSTQINVNVLPLLLVSGNETYGATPDGLTLWWMGNFDSTPVGTAGVVQNTYAWNLWQWAYFGYQTTDLTLNGFFDVVNPDTNNTQSLGMWFGDYFQTNTVVTNADLQGENVGIEGPGWANGETLIENSYFSNFGADVIDSPTGSDAAGPQYSPKSLVLQSDSFSAPSGFSVTAIDMWQTLVGVTGNMSINLTSPDQVFVYSYDQNSAVNFQVYYTQQTASSIMPETGSVTGLVASPVSGLTNQQNWNTYGIATAGAVAPSNATTMAGIDGLVVTLPRGSSNVIIAPSPSSPSVSDAIIAQSPSSPSVSNASAGQGTTATTVAPASVPSAQTQSTALPTIVEPSIGVLAAVASPKTKSAAKVGTSKSVTSGLIAGPLALSGPRRNQVTQPSTSSRLSPVTKFDL